jgi:Molybdopterin oxidoreductase
LRKSFEITKVTRLWSVLALVSVMIAALAFAASGRAQQALYPLKEGIIQPLHTSDIPRWMTLDMEMRGRTEEQTSLGYVSGKDRLYELTRVWEGMTVVPANWLTLYAQFLDLRCGLQLRCVDARPPYFEYDANQISTCVKGKFGWEFVNNKDRLQRPLIRYEGGFREAAWEEALALVAEQLGAIKQETGPDSIAVVVSSKTSNEDGYLMQKFARVVIGTNNVDNCSLMSAPCYARAISNGWPGWG